MSFCYSAFGLTLASDLRCPELLPGHGEPDVTITLGPVPTALPDAVSSGVRYQAAPGRFLLVVDDVARYLVRDGAAIVIDPHPEADEDDVRVFLMASAVGALLHQRGLLALHASAVKVGEACVAFLGRSGIGKSTLAMAFQQRGYPVLTDDISVVTFDEAQRGRLEPGYPMAKLWRDALARFAMDPDELRPIRRQLEKRAVPLNGHFHGHALPCRRFYVLNSTNRDAFTMKPLAGPDAFFALKTHTYRFRFLEGLGLQTAHFRKVAALAAQVPVTRVTRPMHPFRLDELVDRLEADLLEADLPA